MSQASVHPLSYPSKTQNLTSYLKLVLLHTLSVSFDDPIKLKVDNSGIMCVVCGTMAKIDWLLPGDLNGDLPRGQMVT